MTNLTPPLCKEIRIASMARLDGERVDLTSTDIEMHIAVCPACANAIGALTALHADLKRMDYESLDVDLWPALERKISPAAMRRTPREGWMILAVTAILVAWRLAQLLFALPAPVLNSVVPLVIVIIVLRRLAGDPFAIQPTHQLQ